MENILIIENEENLANFIESELENEGYYARVSLDGREGFDVLNEKGTEWHLVLLDVNLPNLNGMEICRRIRETSSVPVVFMTQRDSVIDRVAGLDQGADDYIVKPFAIEELLARVRALFRRIHFEKNDSVESQSTVHFKDLVVEKENRLVRRGDDIIDLTKREYELLMQMLTNVNNVQDRNSLLKNVWGYEEEDDTNVVDVYVRYLRNKLDKPGDESYIQTIRGTGYVMRDYK